MKIAIINGSSRQGQKSILVSRFLHHRLTSLGTVTSLLDVASYNFPVMEERLRFLTEPPAGMVEFSQKMQEAQGLILVTPEYNGSYSGALKNTLDYFKAEYERKVFGLVTVSNGRMGGANAMHHLQAWAIHVKGIVSPYKLYVDEVENQFDESGNLLQGSLEKKLDPFLTSFLWLTQAISAAKPE